MKRLKLYLDNQNIHESQNLLEVREWKRKTSEEIERLGFSAFTEKCHNDLKALREEIECHRLKKKSADLLHYGSAGR